MCQKHKHPTPTHTHTPCAALDCNKPARWMVYRDGYEPAPLCLFDALAVIAEAAALEEFAVRIPLDLIES